MTKPLFYTHPRDLAQAIDVCRVNACAHHLPIISLPSLGGFDYAPLFTAGPDEWQPLDTAPRLDTLTVDLWHKERGRLADCVRYGGLWYQHDDGRLVSLHDQPFPLIRGVTHWRNVPEGPQT